MAEPEVPGYQPISLDTDALAEKAVEGYRKANAKIWRDLSPNRKKEIREEFHNIMVNLRESLATQSPVFLIDFSSRATSRLSARSFPEGFAVRSLEVLGPVVAEDLPQDYRKKAGLILKEAITALKTSSPKTVSAEEMVSISPVAEVFLEALLEGKIREAETIIGRELDGGMPLREIYLTLFQPALVETGRRWQTNEIGIDREHAVSASILRLMGRMEEKIPPKKPGKQKKKTVVAACVGEELHEIGIRMVADLFRTDGWDVRYLGANIPASSILSAIREEKPAIAALSVTMPSRLPELHYLIRSVRADPGCAGTRIIAGGYPFILIPDLWKRIGADAGAAGAAEAVETARRLTAGKH